MAVASKHSGGPCTKYYEDAETIQRFEPIRVWLGKNYKEVRRP